MLIFCWPLPFLVKIDTTIFEVNMTNHSQDITKKQFQRQLRDHHMNKFYYTIQSRRKLFSKLFRRNMIDDRCIIDYFLVTQT